MNQTHFWQVHIIRKLTFDQACFVSYEMIIIAKEILKWNNVLLLSLVTVINIEMTFKNDLENTFNEKYIEFYDSHFTILIQSSHMFLTKRVDWGKQVCHQSTVYDQIVSSNYINII